MCYNYSMNSKQVTYIQLDSNEDIPSVRDRLSFIRGQRVLLIWPEQGTALTRKIDLVLVQREARRRIIQLALVTHDESVINHANELGISTFETIKEAEKSRWKRGRTKVFINRYHKPEDSPEPDDLMPVASRIRKPRKGLPTVARVLIRVCVLAVVIGVVLGTLYVTLPSATVTLAMAQETIQVETTITADPNVLDIDVENRVIPATRFQVTVQTVQQIETTGSQEGSSTRAIGVVTFSNDTDTVVTIPIGTQIRTNTASQVVFETTSIAIVPPNDSIDNVPIIAAEDFSGTIGNVAAGAINTVIGDLSDSISVSSDVPTSGGANQAFNVVTAEDRDRLRGIARQFLQGVAYSEIEADLTDTQTIIIESLNIPEELMRDDWISFSHSIGDITELLTLDMRVIVEALVIDDRFAQQIVFAQVSADIPEGMSLNPESFLYLRGPVIETDTENRTTFRAFGEGIASAQLDRFALQSDLTGRPFDNAQRVIAATTDIAPNSQVQISIWPSWFNRMPLLPVRINVEIEGNS